MVDRTGQVARDGMLFIPSLHENYSRQENCNWGRFVLIDEEAGKIVQIEEIIRNNYCFELLF